MLVHAIDARAREFYLKVGFSSSPHRRDAADAADAADERPSRLPAEALTQHWNLVFEWWAVTSFTEFHLTCLTTRPQPQISGPLNISRNSSFVTQLPGLEEED